MHQRVLALEQARPPVPLGQVQLGQADAGHLAQRRDLMGVAAGGQHLVARLGQGDGDMAADEARGTGDEDAHGGSRRAVGPGSGQSGAPTRRHRATIKG